MFAVTTKTYSYFNTSCSTCDPFKFNLCKQIVSNAIVRVSVSIFHAKYFFSNYHVRGNTYVIKIIKMDGQQLFESTAARPIN